MMTHQLGRGVSQPNMESQNASSSLFVTLPFEVLVHITSHLDVLSTIQLSRVARPFLTLANDIIWRDLKLALPDNFGESSLDQQSVGSKRAEDGGIALALQDAPRDYNVDWRTELKDLVDRLSKAEAVKRIKELRPTALRAKVDTIIARADETRWPLVKSLRLDPRHGSVLPMLKILERVAPTLESLRIEAIVPYLPHTDDLSEICDPLQLRIMQSNLTFSSLHHLRLRSIAWEPQLVLYLCRDAPNLVSLDVELHLHELVACPSHPESKWERESRINDVLRTILSATKLRQIRFGIYEPQYQSRQTSDDLWLEKCFGELVAPELLERSPQLEQLIYDCKGLMPSMDILIDAFSGAENLRDLYLPPGLTMVDLWIRGRGYMGYDNLRRLLWDVSSWLDVYESLPHFCNVEILFVGPPSTCSISTYRTHPHVQSMLPEFSLALRYCPTLTTIHPAHVDVPAPGLDIFTQLDQLERRGDLGLIRSLINGEEEVDEDMDDDDREEARKEELLVARLLLPVIDSTDHPSLPDFKQHSLKLDSQYLSSTRGKTRERIYTQCPPTWQDFSDYDELVVPYEVITRMLEVAGIEEAEWTGRRLKVGKAAWKVLTDWRDAHDVQLASEG